MSTLNKIERIIEKLKNRFEPVSRVWVTVTGHIFMS